MCVPQYLYLLYNTGGNWKDFLEISTFGKIEYKRSFKNISIIMNIIKIKPSIRYKYDIAIFYTNSKDNYIIKYLVMGGQEIMFRK